MGEVTELPVPRAALTPPAPITAEHDVSEFDCGKIPLNDWLHRHALKNEGRASRCFVTCSSRTVVGFYCLAAGSVEHAEVPSSLKRNMPPIIPVLVLGRMAVDKQYQGHGIGGALLKDAMGRAVSAATEIGAAALLVHAIDREAVPFYVQYGFQAFPEGSLTLYLPMKTIAAAYEAK
jgi:GNAT superfamily N-acetyltransferase